MTEQHLQQQFGSYRLLRLLGQGGFSEVYLGEHVYLKTQAAIKILKLHMAQHELKDFLKEARIIAHLEHPHIVRVLDFGLERNTPFLVLDYAPHGSLRQRYPKGTQLALATIVSYVKELADALQHAHAQQLVHGDVKPENILLGKHDELLLSDFGVAAVAHGSHSSHRSRQHEISGTVAYMIPEQLRGKPSPASDQYAVGIVVYEWLCGSRPFNGSFTEIALQHLHASPPSLHERVPTISPALEEIVMRALAKEPAQRFASVQDFALALEEVCRGDPGSRPQVAARAPSTEVTRPAASIDNVPPAWNIPYHRNLFFTGREEVLERLYAMLRGSRMEGAAQPVAISGLGGIGKTQTAVEYAYRYQADYQAVLWARADSFEALLADAVSIAGVLNLPTNEVQDQQHAINAVKHWLATHTNWLLTLDNVEDLTLVSGFIPPASKGHILLTSRMQATGTVAQRLELEKMSLDEGALFLLRRAGMIEPGASVEHAADFISCNAILQHPQAAEADAALGKARQEWLRLLTSG